MTASQKKIVLAAIAFTLLFSVLILILIIPLARGVLSSSKDLAEKKQEILSLQSKEDTQEDFLQFSEARRTDLQNLSTIFLNPLNPTDFLSYLESAAGDSGVLLTIVPGNTYKAEQNRWPFIEFSVSSRGSFPDIVSFLRKVEYAPYLLDIKSLDITQDRDSVKTTLLLKAYTQ